jgi:predicted Zn-dependent peptidase
MAEESGTIVSKQFDVRRQVGQLKNGVPVIVYYKPGAPISARAVFLAGARYEPAQNPGLAHFTEHMTLSGSKRFPTNEAIALYFNRFGGAFNAFTSPEQLALTYSLADKDDFRHVGVMMNESLTQYLLDPESLERERGVVSQELTNYMSNPASAINFLFSRVVFQGSGLERNVIGTHESIAGFRREDVDSFIKNFLSPERMAMVVAGGIEVDQVVRDIDAELDLPDQAERLTQILPPPLVAVRKRAIEIEQFSGNPNVKIFLGFRTEPIGHKDNPAIGLLASVLGYAWTGRLHKRLREKDGLVYSVSTGSWQQSDTGALVVRTSCKKENLNKVLKAIGEEMAAVVDSGARQSELDFIRERTIKSTKIGLQTSGSWLGSYATDELYGVAKSLDQELEELEAVKLADISRVARRYLTNNNWYVALAGDVAESDIDFELKN